MGIIERLREEISKRVYLKFVLPVLLLAILILYFKAFFTAGIYFDGTFLKKKVHDSEINYVGKSKHGKIHITVRGVSNEQDSLDVIYNLPNEITLKYNVTFEDANNQEVDRVSIKRDDGYVVFEGYYGKHMPFLFDKNNQPLIDYNAYYNQEIEYNANYRIPLKDIADMASFTNETIRGKGRFLVWAILILGITAIDMKYPLFFFTMRNSLSVKNPEPSDFYITMQRIQWHIAPIIGLILLIVAIY